MTTKVLTNGVLFRGADLLGDPGKHSDCMIVSGSQIDHVGTEGDHAVQKAKQQGAEVIDLEQRIVVPGFIDSHVHILHFGLSLQKLDLESCKSLAEVRSAISAHAKKHPELPRILCRGWQQPSTNGEALASALDDLDTRPIFVESLDCHSAWCNTPALNELPTDRIKEVCPEYLPCDESGRPTGLVAESAVIEFVWSHLLEQCTPDEIQEALGKAFEAYIKAGYTGIIDMAMDKHLWDSLETYSKNRGLPIHVAAHWFVPYTADAGQRRKRFDEALEMHREWHPSKSREFCVVGVKLISDGVVDGCTAALSRPYGGKTQLVHPIWPKTEMEAVIKKAVDAGMQCAVHAIGDLAITQTIDCIASARNPQGRHRVEHLETANEEDAKRLGRLGITASVQPIHSDPARLIGYSKILGPEAWSRAFPYREFADGDACVAIGSDAPTASYLPLQNLYSATTRKSVVRPDYPGQTNVNGALSMVRAVTAATYGAAYSRFAESWVGRLDEGLQADFVVLDAVWSPEKLLEAKVHQTWTRGEKVYQAMP